MFLFASIPKEIAQPGPFYPDIDKCILGEERENLEGFASKAGCLRRAQHPISIISSILTLIRCFAFR